MYRTLFRIPHDVMPGWICAAIFAVAVFGAADAISATLEVRPALDRCGVAEAALPAVPATSAARIPDSQAVRGTSNIAWVWLGSSTSRYPHAALGSSVHAASLHVLLAQPDGSQRALSLDLTPNRVIEDRLPRLADLDGDGRDEIILVESDDKLGSSLVVYGLRLGAGARQPVLAQLARSPFIGTANRWLNPVGVADFDGDGRLDIAAVSTPHLGGVLTLYRYQPPGLDPVAIAPGFSNHRNGSAEQQLAAIVHRPGRRPTVILAGNDLQTLHAIGIEGLQGWKAQSAPVRLPASVRRMTSLSSGACVLMMNGATVQVTLGD